MFAEISWDIAGIISACAVFLTSVGGFIVIYRQNRNHSDRAINAASKVEEHAVTVDSAAKTLAEQLASFQETVLQGFTQVNSRLDEMQGNQDVLFGMLTDLDLKVTKSANRSRKTVVSQETPATVLESA